MIRQKNRRRIQNYEKKKEMNYYFSFKKNKKKLQSIIRLLNMHFITLASTIF